jgi:hypothetical protein
MPLGLINLATGQSGIPAGGAGMVLIVLGLLMLGLLAYIAYRLWVRPSRRLILIIAVWTAVAAAWSVTAIGLYWQLVLDVAFLAACVLAWNEDRVIHRVPATRQQDASP